MTCSSCTHAVEQALLDLHGVTSAVVSMVQQEARVEYRAESVSKVASAHDHLQAASVSSTPLPSSRTGMMLCS